MKKIKLTIILTILSTIIFAQAWQINGNPGIAPANFLGSLNNAQLNFRTNANFRFVLDNGGVANNAGSAAFGNNLPLNFTPSARLHLHQTCGVVTMRFSNNTTGLFIKKKITSYTKTLIINPFGIIYYLNI